MSTEQFTVHRIVVPALAEATSVLGFGTGGLLRIGSARERLRILAAAFDRGITHFDTAPIYGFGESERTLGRFLQGRRSQMTLASKFGLQPSRLAVRLAPLQRVARRCLRLLPAVRSVAARNTAALYSRPNFSVAVVRASIESSLRALRTDYLDCYLAHQICLQTIPGEELIDLLQTLRRHGKIRAFGIATDFVNVAPVLERCPALSGIIQFDSDITHGNVSRLAQGTHRLLITFGSLNRSMALCRERLQSLTSAQQPVGTIPQKLVDELRHLDDESLGALLLRAAMLANAGGIVLMQSRHVARIERNVRIACDTSADERAHALVQIAGAAW